MNAIHILFIAVLAALGVTTAMIGRALQVSRRVQRGEFG